ncbi:MAG TPA: hypothetical protein VKF62_12255, partial [Planctomycetota bacterium]|nr:hypothetical protein [Planctomycetota bacterium]
GSGAQPGSESSAASPGRADALPPERALDPFQGELLDLAYRAASAMPLNPHVKNRSRAQEAVVAACLDLDQPRRALRYIEGIQDWRRGAAYADLAFHCARRGEPNGVQGYLDLAGQIAEENAKDENAQEWRRDRIRTKIAKTHVWLGEARRAEAFEADVVDSEQGKVDAVRAMRLEAADFDRQVEALEGVVANGSLDRVQNALATYTRLLDRFYDDAEKRARIEEKVAAAHRRLPALARLESRMELAEVALGHGDRAKALEQVEEAKRTMEGTRWLPEHELPVRGRLAGLRHRAGDAEGARREAAAALATFDANRERIVDIYRAGALRPLAEAYEAMGDAGSARKVYGMAIEEGVANPNSRPRAEDLSATCCSMATNRVDPGSDLRARMLQICEGLGPPW